MAFYQLNLINTSVVLWMPLCLLSIKLIHYREHTKSRLIQPNCDQPAVKNDNIPYDESVCNSRSFCLNRFSASSFYSQPKSLLFVLNPVALTGNEITLEVGRVHMGYGR
jgi:hypothetical protein